METPLLAMVAMIVGAAVLGFAIGRLTGGGSRVPPTFHADNWEPASASRKWADQPEELRATMLQLAVNTGESGHEAIRIAGLYLHFIKTGEPLVRS